MITLDTVRFAYDDFEVIKGISFAIEGDERVAIIGRNGAGKTTLLRLMRGDLISERGGVFLNGDTVSALSPKQRAMMISYVSQNTPYTQDFSVFEVLLTGRYPYSGLMGYSEVDYSKTREVLMVCELEPYEERKFTTLSKGEQKRVLIGRALVQDTPVLLLDEPTSELDLKYQNELMQLVIKEAMKEKKTVVAVMHDLVLATRYFNRLLLIENGAIIADGNPRKVITEDNLKRAYDIDAKVDWLDDEPVIKLKEFI